MGVGPPNLPPSQGWDTGAYPTTGTFGYPLSPVAAATSGQPTPVVSSLSPATAKVGDPLLRVTVTGDRFTAASIVTVAGTAQPTYLIDDRHVYADINPVGASAGAKAVLVNNGGVAAPTPVTFTFTP